MANVKTDISLRKSLLEEAEVVAREMKISRSHLFMMAVEDFIQRYRNKKLLERINIAYQDDTPDENEKQRLSQMRRHHRKLAEGEW
jgi:metal-responsive CopG/Arc/MetJ family transcriptional regulator